MSELRYEMIDTNFNQWADAAAVRLAFVAIRVSGRVIDQISLGGMVTNVIYITGRASDNVTNLAGKIEQRITLAGRADSNKVSNAGKITEEPVQVTGKVEEKISLTGGSE